MESNNDPAILFYKATWLLVTKRMKAEQKGWFFSLVVHLFDRGGSLPDDMEELISAAEVRVSEMERFNTCWEQVFKPMFVLKDGFWTFPYVNQILQKREVFQEKRSFSGKKSVFSKYIRKNHTKDENIIVYVLKHTSADEIQDSSDSMLKQVFKQKYELYINENDNENDNTIKNIKEETGTLFHSVEQYKVQFDNDFLIDQDVVRENDFTPENLVQARLEFWNTKKLDEELVGKSYNDVKRHFLAYCRKNKVRLKAASPSAVKRIGSDTDYAGAKTSL